MHPITFVVPGWAVPWLGVATALGMLLTLIANATTHITDAEISEMRKKSYRIASLLVLSRHFGIVVWPGLKAAWGVLRGAVKLVPAAMVLMLLSCAGSTTTIGVNGGGTVTPGGDVNWTAGIQIGITVARTALPITKAALDANPGISVATRTSIDEGFRIAIDSMPLAQTALDTFSHAPTGANLCQVRFYVEQAITGALQSLTLAKDAGAQIDPMIGGALGGLASVADMIGGNCASSSAPPMARTTSAQERVRAVLAR